MGQVLYSRKNFKMGAVLGAISLAACGGGGGSGTPSPPVVNPPPAPTREFTSASSADVVESAGGSVLNVAVTAVTGETVQFMLSGDDEDDFTIDSTSGALQFVVPPNFEVPFDSDGDNIYDVTATAAYSGGISITQDIAITVTDINEPPAISSANNASLAENTLDTGLVVTTQEQDAGDIVSYSITGGTDQALLAIDSVAGNLRFVAAPDFEAPADSDQDNVYVIIVTATDIGGLLSIQQISVTVSNINEPPFFVSSPAASLFENSVAAAYTAVADDPEAAVFYELVGGADRNQFLVVSPTGEIFFSVPPDHENPTDANADNVYEIDLLATDDGGLTDTLSVQLTVDDVSQIEVAVTYPTAFANIGGEASGSVVRGTMIDVEDGVVDFGDATSIVANGVTASLVLPDRWSADNVPVTLFDGINVVATSESGNQFQVSRDVHNTPHLSCLASFATNSTGTTLYAVDVFLKSVIAIDYPSGASWNIVSDPLRGLGVDLANPTGIVIEPGDQSAVIADDAGSAIVRVDLTTGNRTTISGLGVGSGPPLQGPSDVALGLSGTSLMVPDFLADTILDVSLTDGSRSILFDATIGTGVAIDGPGTVLIDALGNRVFVTSQIMSGVYSIDLATGNRQVVSDNTQGIGLGVVLPFDLVTDTAVLTGYMSDVASPGVIFRIDLTTGDRTTIGPPNFGPAALHLDESLDWLVVGDCVHREIAAYSPSDGSRLATLVDGNRGLSFIPQVLHSITYDHTQDRIILPLTNIEGTLAAVPLEAGFVTPFSSSLRGIGSGPSLDAGVRDPQIDADNNRLLLVSALGLVAVDLTTGDRSVLSGTSVGSGQNFVGPTALAHDPAADVAYVMDFDGTLHRVDLGTGNRLIVSSSTVGSGPALVLPRDMDIDVARNRVVVVDADLNAILWIDLTTGMRTILSDTNNGTGLDFIVPQGIAMDLVNSRVLVTNRLTAQNTLGPEVTEAGIIAVDPVTGNRSVVNHGRPFPAGASDLSVDDDGRRIFLLDSILRMLLVIDSETGETALIDIPLGTVL